MSKMIELIVDNKKYSVKEGSLLIDLLIKEEIKVPYFCYHEALGADGNCRMCMVEIEGQKRPQIACDTLVKEGMEVRSTGTNIEKVRTDILELELINHPVDCPTCDQAGECSLQDFYMDYGLHDSKITIPEKVKHLKKIDLGSNVMLDQERCVLCARCTRFTTDITKTNELGIIGRGDHARVSTAPGRKLDNPYAMNVVDLCPVGALTSKDFRFKQRVWFLKTAESVCHGCAKGCNIFIDHNKMKYQDDVIYRFRPRRNDDVNGFFMCDEGRLSYKELQTNRQEDILLNNSIVSEERVIEELNNLIKIHKGNINILMDANLYTEEMETIVDFAKTIDAKVYAPLDVYIDESFKDDMLKSSNRASNSKTIEKMDIETTLPENSGLLINFNHPSTANADKKVSFRTHKSASEDIILPLASFADTEGHVCNEDGIVQKCEKALNRNNPSPTVIEWIEKVMS
ncbi:NADH-ubiquinone oxidoreductase chain G [hydrothermal vent metagenome]|uniref:NADH-ubiquinone oxidoreductase chain G n=1 Tax=hydrothermal vent metagenome TaxID=652676 RepID=A0A1W1EBJ2_9ZZZZ